MNAVEWIIAEYIPLWKMCPVRYRYKGNSCFKPIKVVFVRENNIATEICRKQWNEKSILPLIKMATVHCLEGILTAERWHILRHDMWLYSWDEQLPSIVGLCRSWRKLRRTNWPIPTVRPLTTPNLRYVTRATKLRSTSKWCILYIQYTDVMCH